MNRPRGTSNASSNRRLQRQATRLILSLMTLLSIGAVRVVADSPRTTHGPVIHRLIAQGIRYDVAPLPHASNASYVYPAASIDPRRSSGSSRSEGTTLRLCGP